MGRPPYVAVVYEDHHPTQTLVQPRRLEQIVRRVRQDIRPRASLPLEPFYARGAGNFAREVRLQLERPAAPAFVVAVGDADRPGNLVRGFAADKASPSFAHDLRAAWEAALQGEVGATNVFAVPIRWSSESVALAALEALPDVFGDLTTFWTTCSPDPRTVAPADFCTTYLDVHACLCALAARVGKKSLKNDVELADVLRRVHESAHHRARVRARLPDLDVLGRLLVDLEDRVSPPGDGA